MMNRIGEELSRTCGKTAITFLVLFIGCSASESIDSEYDPSDDRTTYKTSTFTVAQGATQSFASANSITMQAVASCEGQGCTPHQATFVFSIEGSSDVTLSNRTLKIKSDNKEWTLENRSSGYRRNSQIGRTKGRLASMSFSISELEKISNSSSLTGYLGDKALSLENVKSSLRKLISKMKATHDSSATSGV